MSLTVQKFAGLGPGGTGFGLGPVSSMSHTHLQAEITNLVTDLAAKEATANKGVASGYASLNGSVLVVEDPANAQTTPAANKIVKALATGRIANGWGVAHILRALRLTDTATGATFQTVTSQTVAANTLGTTDGVMFDFRLRRTTGTGNYTLRVSYGGTVVLTFAATTLATTRVTGVIFGNGATNAQRAHGEESRGGAAPVTGTSAVDSTADQALLLEVDFVTDTDVLTVDWCSLISLKG